MRIRSYRVFRHYVLDLAVASLIPFMATACAARQRTADRPRLRPAPEPILAFENSTIEPVSVYLEERGSQWFVGYVLAGEQANFRLPTAASAPAGRQFTLVVVPSSARRRTTAMSAAFPGPISAEQLPGEYLTNVRWRLTGKWLVPLPIPPRP